MKPQIISNKDKNQILQRIESLAKSYTPDWNPDFSEPDFGSALALIFRDMYIEQVDRLNRTPEKQRRDIVNLFEPVPYGPEASRGYVCFELSEGASGGIFLEKGFQLLADGPEDSEIHFETTESLYVSHAKLQQAVVYDHESGWLSVHESEDAGLSFPLFKVEYEDNKNKPSFTISDPKWLYARGGMTIGLYFRTSHELDQDRLLEGLCDPQKAYWHIQLDDQYVELKVNYENKCIWLSLDDSFRLSGEIKCILIDIPFFRDIEISELSMELKMESLKPDRLLYNDDLLDMESSKPGEGIQPFGDQFSIFDVFMIGDDDIFLKPGASIQVDMKIKQHLVPITTTSDETLIKWRNVMHESELREPEPRTIRIDSVIWEYWNGIGWSPLDVNKEAYELPQEGPWQINFVCPNDIEKAIFGPAESTYVRMRITSIQNAFAPKGNTAVPVITKIGLSANTLEQRMAIPVRPDSLVISSNMESTQYKGEDIGNTEIQMAKSPDEDIQKVVYLSLSSALTKGPIRFEVGPEFKSSGAEPVTYKIQYYGTRSGREGWQDLPHEDETNGFIMNGLISFMSPDKMIRIMRFGIESFWLRLVPMSGPRQMNIPNVYDRSLNMRLNAVRVKQKETLTSEYYSVPAIQPWAKIFLSRAPILEAEVWMNEIGIISDEEIDLALETEPENIHIENDKRGEQIGVWRKWHRIESFTDGAIDIKHDGRIFTLDLELGRIMFGDGKTGRIPHSDLPEYIRVDYALGGGLAGNLDPGKINKAVTSIPFLEKVYNGNPIWGGLGTELTRHAEKRVSEHIRHRGLALSHRDIEAIIEGHNRDIHDVKVTGSRGQISVSILPDAFPYQISHFFEIKEKTERILTRSISTMVSDQNRVSINAPIQIAFSVNMDVVVQSAGDYIKALSRWNEQLERYFHPLYGGPKQRGWKIGQLPEHAAILADLKHMLQGSEFIDNVMIQMHLVDGDKRIPIHHRASGQIDLSHAIPVNGEHDVRIRITNM